MTQGQRPPVFAGEKHRNVLSCRARGRVRRETGWSVCAIVFVFGGPLCALAQGALVSYRASQGEITQPLTAEPGDVQRGRAAVLSRDANCVLCHVVAGGDPNFAGNLAPPLAGIGDRSSAARLRLRIVDSTQINPASIMPAYYRISGLNQVASAYKDKPIFTAQQVEDVVSYLLTLRN